MNGEQVKKVTIPMRQLAHWLRMTDGAGHFVVKGGLEPADLLDIERVEEMQPDGSSSGMAPSPCLALIVRSYDQDAMPWPDTPVSEIPENQPIYWQEMYVSKLGLGG